MNAVGDFLYAHSLLIVAGLGGASVFVTAVTVALRGRLREGPGYERLRQAQAAVHQDFRDRQIVREAIDEVYREDVKAAIRLARSAVRK